MNYGLYCAYLGMRARQERLDSIANNIANTSTSGFKADRLQYRSVEAAEIQANEQSAQTGAPSATAGSSPAGNETVSNPGRLTPTRYGR